MKAAIPNAGPIVNVRGAPQRLAPLNRMDGLSLLYLEFREQ